MARPSTAKLLDNVSDAMKRAVADIDGGYNQFMIDNKTPGFTYIWAAKEVTHPQSVDHMKRIGYEIVNDKVAHKEVAPFADNPTTEGGAIMTYEHVLMRIPTEVAQYREKRVSQLGHERLNNEKQEMQEAIARGGGVLRETKDSY